MDNPWENFSVGDPFSTWWPFIVAVIVGIVTTIRGYMGGVLCPSEATMTERTVVVTGGASGIGLEVVIELLRRGARVVVGARDEEEGMRRVLNELKARGLVKWEHLVKVRELDLSSLQSVRRFVDKLDEDRIDVLINNGGIAYRPYHVTAEGFEEHFVTNYLSHFLLTHLMIPRLVAAEGRVINVSAQAHYAGNICLEDLNAESEFNTNKAFAQSKLALVCMARTMSIMLKDKGVTINVMHPGIVRGTNHMKLSPIQQSVMFRVPMYPWIWLLMKTPQQGAQTAIYLAVAPELKGKTGLYFSNCSQTEPSEKAMDEPVCKALYKKSLRLCALPDNELG